MQDILNELPVICDVAIQVLIVGDLKYFAQLQGRDNMSGSCCMCYMSHPNDWKLNPLPEAINSWCSQ
jgi:hypothetical protein